MNFKILMLSLVVVLPLSAQKKNFTMQEAVLGLTTTLAPKNLKQLKWMGQTEKYVQTISNDQWKGVVATHPETGSRDSVLTLEQLNILIENKQWPKLNAIPTIEWIDENTLYFQHDNKLMYFNRNATNWTLTQYYDLPKDAENLTYSSGKSTLAYTSGYNIHIQSAADHKTITADGHKDLLYGTSVHRDEFGIDHGLFWSPKGNALAYYRMDQTMVEDYPVVDWSVVPAVAKTVKYPFVGRTSHQVKLLVYHLGKGKTITLNTGEPKDKYLTNITWSPDEKYIFIQELNRGQNHMLLNQYDASTGDFVKTILEEKGNKYVEPQHELYFINTDEFIYWSQRDGYMHLYLYNTSGEEIKQLTKGPWIVNAILGYKEKTKELLITSSENSPLEVNVYAVNIKNGKREMLTEQGATHTVTASSKFNYLIDAYTTTSIPRNIDIVDVNTGNAVNILTSKNPLLDYNTAKVEWKELFTNDQTKLYGKLIYPTDFDVQKRYPVIIYTYNGPHVQLNKNSFPESGNLWYDYMAQRGYVVFVLDGRGSANRGYEFESAIYKQLGKVEMEDQLTGVAYLKTLPFVDSTRMGIHGWSYGGFMTTSLMLRYPDVFKVGVAGGPVLDWTLYEIMYGERYMSTPQENEKGYQENNLMDKVKNLKGKLLLIHGTDDATVIWQHSIKFIKQAVSNNVQVDYFVYPGYEHNVRGKDRVHLMQKISDYFDDYLK